MNIKLLTTHLNMEATILKLESLGILFVWTPDQSALLVNCKLDNDSQFEYVQELIDSNENLPVTVEDSELLFLKSFV